MDETDINYPVQFPGGSLKRRVLLGSGFTEASDGCCGRYDCITLLQKLTDELDGHGTSPHTKYNYVGAVDRLARHYRRSSDQISNEDLKSYLLYLIRDQKRSHSTINVNAGAFHFFSVRC